MFHPSIEHHQNLGQVWEGLATLWLLPLCHQILFGHPSGGHLAVAEGHQTIVDDRSSDTVDHFSCCQNTNRFTWGLFRWTPPWTVKEENNKPSERSATWIQLEIQRWFIDRVIIENGCDWAPCYWLATDSKALLSPLKCLCNWTALLSFHQNYLNMWPDHPWCRGKPEII